MTIATITTAPDGWFAYRGEDIVARIWTEEEVATAVADGLIVRLIPQDGCWISREKGEDEFLSRTWDPDLAEILVAEGRTVRDATR